MVQVKTQEEYPLGLDIGAYVIKAAQLHRRQQGLSLYKLVSIKLPLGLKKEARDTFIINTIKKMIADNGFKKAGVHLTVSSNDSCVRVINIPLMPKEEIPEALRWAAKTYIAYPPEDVAFGYSVLGEVLEQGINKIHLVFLAVQKEIFKRYSNLVKRAGLKPVVVSSPCFSLINIIALDEANKDKAICLINLGFSGSDILIVKNNQLIFTRNIPEGTGSLNESIVSAFSLGAPGAKVDMLKAEEMKNKFGFFREGLPGSIEGLSADKFSSTMDSYLMHLSRELQLSFSHYRQISHGAQVDKVVLAGSGAMAKDICPALSAKLGLAVEIMRMPENIKSDELSAKQNIKEEFVSYAVSIGSALEEGISPNLAFEEKGRPGLNFLAGQKHLKKIIAGLAAFIFIWLGVLLALRVFYSGQIKFYEEKLASLSAKSAELANLSGDIKLILAKKKLFEGLLQSEPELTQALVDISNIIDAKRITLQNLNFDKTEGVNFRLTMQGEINDGQGAPSTDILKGLLAALGEKKYFRDIKPTVQGSAGGGHKEKINFNIQCLLVKE